MELPAQRTLPSPTERVLIIDVCVCAPCHPLYQKTAILTELLARTGAFLVHVTSKNLVFFARIQDEVDAQLLSSHYASCATLRLRKMCMAKSTACHIDDLPDHVQRHCSGRFNRTMAKLAGGVAINTLPVAEAILKIDAIKHCIAHQSDEELYGRFFYHAGGATFDNVETDPTTVRDLVVKPSGCREFIERLIRPQPIALPAPPAPPIKPVTTHSRTTTQLSLLMLSPSSSRSQDDLPDELPSAF